MPQHARQNKGMENKLYTIRDLANRFKRFGLSIAWLKAEAETLGDSAVSKPVESSFSILTPWSSRLHAPAPPKGGELMHAETAIDTPANPTPENPIPLTLVPRLLPALPRRRLRWEFQAGCSGP